MAADPHLLGGTCCVTATRLSIMAQLPVDGCSGLMKPDTHLGENARHREVSDDQATSYLYP